MTDPMNQAPPDDQALDNMIGLILRGGVILAAIIGVIGGFMYLTANGGQTVAFHVFGNTPAGLRSPGAIVAGALHLRAQWIIQLALLVLIATPIARVGLSLAAFAKQRDWTYVVISSIVLALLAFSLMAGKTL